MDSSPNKKYLSATQINMYLRCPRQYEYRYIEGIKIPPSGALVLGRAWHEAIEHNYNQKIQSREPHQIHYLFGNVSYSPRGWG